MTENLSDYCAQGSNCQEEMIPVTGNISLKVITFTPAIENDNPVILFIPGWISLIKGWKEVLQEMTKDFTVYYVETREKISSNVTGKIEYSVEATGKDIVELISKLNLKNQRYVLFGSSLGATSILDCYRFMKEDPLCLVLIGPNAEFRIPRYGIVMIKLFYPPFYNFFKPYVKWYLKTFRLDAKSDRAQYEKYSSVLDAADPWKLKRAALAVSKYTVWNLLSAIKYPALIIGASKDKLHEPDNLKRIVSMMKFATYIDLETNKGTHSKEVVDEVRKYLSNL